MNVAGSALVRRFSRYCLDLRGLAVGCACVLCLFQTCWAQDSTQSRLDEINRQFEDQSQLLTQVSSRLLALETELSKLRKSVERIRAEEKRLQAELAQRQSSKELLIREISRIEGETERIGVLSRQRVRALYMSQSWEARGNMLLALASRPAAFSRHAFYLRRLRDYDMEMLRMLSELQIAREEGKKRLETVIAEAQLLQQTLKIQAAELHKRLQRQETLVKNIKVEKSQVQDTLTALRAQALRLETVVASLTGAVAPLAGTSLKERIRDDIEPKEPREPFQGVGLRALKGKLRQPVQGRIVRDFGKQRSMEFDEIVLSKGWEYQTSPGASVHAVGPGKVIYAGTMPGYQAVVILDHGRRSYSLYGRLKETLKRLGDEVSGGEAIAVTSQPDHRGRNFYFELRENGAPVDPAKYIPKR